MTVIYRAGRQRIKVRAVMVLSLICAAVTLWWGWNLFQSYGSRPADGGELAALPVRLLVGGLVASLGVTFAAGMCLYGRLYISKLELDETTGRLHVHTLRFVGEREEVFDASDVLAGRDHTGRSDFLVTPSVNAPWTSVRLPGRWLPRILDAQGEFADPDLSQKILRVPLRLSREAGRRTP